VAVAVEVGGGERRGTKALRQGNAGLRAGANPAGIDATKALIAIANHETDYVTLLSGNGKGGFTPRTLHLHSKPHPHAAAAGDFDRDGRHDLAVDSAGEKRIMLLFGRDGWRGPGTPIDLGTNPYWTISAADMDGDGNVDLVTPNGDYSARIAAGDINGDGFADAVFANSNGATVTIVYGSRGGPRKTASVPVMPHPHAVTIAGRDIIVATEDEDRLLVVRGR